MHRPIRTTWPLPVIDGVLIKRAALREGVAAKRLTDEARRRARTIVRKAQIEADSIRQRASEEGFQKGFESGLQGIKPWLDAFGEWCRNALSPLRDEIRSKLRLALNDAAVVDFVIGTVFADSGHWVSEWRTIRIRITVPKTCAHLVEDLEARLEDAVRAQTDLAVGNDDRLVIECGPQVYIFDAAALADAVVNLSR